MCISYIKPLRCLPYCKGTILKAIHNCTRSGSVLALVFTVLQRYDFESNSQRLLLDDLLRLRCLPYCKGTILKAIHNLNGIYVMVDLVFTVLQRYDFESNSQLHRCRCFFGSRCLPYCKGTILKAIHNLRYLLIVTPQVFTVLQRYDFESNSQHHCK